MEAKYWLVVVQFTTDNGKGKEKKTKENFLVAATNATDAERNTYQLLEGETDFSVVSAKKSNIMAVKLTEVDI